MAHRIIVSKKASATETASIHAIDIEAEITYTPSHDLTPEQVGDRVTKILKKIDQMGE